MFDKVLLIKIATVLGKEPDFILKNNEYRIFEEIPGTTNMNEVNDNMVIDSLLESGTYNPSPDFLTKVAHSLGKEMQIILK